MEELEASGWIFRVSVNFQNTQIEPGSMYGSKLWNPGVWMLPGF